MYYVVIAVHGVVCLFLVAVILLQAGRGGGLSDIAGGQPQSILGTQTNQFMTRVTEVCAVLFVVTSVTLGIMTSHRGKSLFEKEAAKQALKSMIPPITVPVTPAPASTTPAAVAAAEVPQKTSE